MYGDSWLPECGGVKVSAGHALEKVSGSVSMRDFRASQIFTSAVGILHFLYRFADYLGPHGNGATDKMVARSVVNSTHGVSTYKSKLLPSRIFRLESQP